MPPRKRKVPEKSNDEVVEDNPVEATNENADKPAGRKRRIQKNKQKSVEVETVSADQAEQATTEKHVVIKLLLTAQTNEAFHAKYIKELTNQYAKV